MLAILRKSTRTHDKKFGRDPGDDMPEIDNNAMIWRIFTSATMKAAEHLGQDYQENLCTTKNTDFEKGQAVVRQFLEIDPESK